MEWQTTTQGDSAAYLRARPQALTRSTSAASAGSYGSSQPGGLGLLLGRRPGRLLAARQYNAAASGRTLDYTGGLVWAVVEVPPAAQQRVHFSSSVR